MESELLPLRGIRRHTVIDGEIWRVRHPAQPHVLSCVKLEGRRVLEKVGVVEKQTEGSYEIRLIRDWESIDG